MCRFGRRVYVMQNRDLGPGYFVTYCNYMRYICHAIWLEIA